MSTAIISALVVVAIVLYVQLKVVPSSSVLMEVVVRSEVMILLSHLHSKYHLVSTALLTFVETANQ